MKTFKDSAVVHMPQIAPDVHQRESTCGDRDAVGLKPSKIAQLNTFENKESMKGKISVASKEGELALD